jgi:hypothetical protein
VTIDASDAASDMAEAFSVADDAIPVKAPLWQKIAWDYGAAVVEADYWNRVCADWTRSFGRGIWRERHPSDLHKLCMRRASRAYVRQILTSGLLHQALAEFEGRAQ